MAKQLFAYLARPVRVRIPRPLLAVAGVLLLGLIIAAGWAAATPQPAVCESICQCWYCPEYTWGDFDGDGNSEFRCDSPCDHGCVGTCAYSDTEPHLPGTCSQVPGQGGCGPVCSCRDGDCVGAPVATTEPPPAVTPEPTPPPGCPPPGEVREWTELIPPKLTFAKYKPDHPVVVEQDPDKQGFRMQITGEGGRYEHKTQQLEKWCGPASAGETQGRYPAACGAAAEWHYECPIRCVECYDDPFDAIQVRMRLADSSLEWLQGELASRYTGAQPREGLPRTWQLAGVHGLMTLDQWWIYAPGKPDILSNGPLDPGIHGGKIVGWTVGTPKSPPQVVERAFSVPVFLLDTTIAR